jgi:hypothetical protein
MQKVSNPIIHVDANLTPTPSLASLPAHDYQPVSVRAFFLVNQSVGDEIQCGLLCSNALSVFNRSMLIPSS